MANQANQESQTSTDYEANTTRFRQIRLNRFPQTIRTTDKRDFHKALEECQQAMVDIKMIEQKLVSQEKILRSLVRTPTAGLSTCLYNVHHPYLSGVRQAQELINQMDEHVSVMQSAVTEDLKEAERGEQENDTDSETDLDA